MDKFIALQYQMGKITAAGVLAFVPRYLTAEEADKILKGKANHGL